MSTVPVEFIGGGAFILASLGLTYAYFKTSSADDSSNTPPASVIDVDTESSGESHRSSSPKIQIYTSGELIDKLMLGGTINSIQTRCALTPNNFDRDCLPLIHAVIEYAQLLPASESHHHAQPGGLIVHMLETVQHALQLRNGHMLPRGAAPEEVTAKQHRWTYGIIVAAFLHDIARPMADLNVHLYIDSKARRRWQPLTGSMRDSGASHYSIDFEVENREYELHQKLPITLMQSLVPKDAMQWLAEDEELIEELTQYLSGVKSDTSAIREIVTKADSESVKRNLLLGSRTRFAVAKTIPLIERLMWGIREMHKNGLIAVNRPGACGWVYGDDIWYVSKRLADEVREFLAESKVTGIPGPDKNDRLFDTWQEYGALIQTPAGRAVWDVVINMPEFENKRLTVLRFPLEKIFGQDKSVYPGQINGTITINDGQSESPSASTKAAEVKQTEQAKAPQGEKTQQNVQLGSAPNSKVQPLAQEPAREVAPITRPAAALAQPGNSQEVHEQTMSSDAKASLNNTVDGAIEISDVLDDRSPLAEPVATGNENTSTGAIEVDDIPPWLTGADDEPTLPGVEDTLPAVNEKATAAAPIVPPVETTTSPSFSQDEGLSEANIEPSKSSETSWATMSGDQVRQALVAETLSRVVPKSNNTKPRKKAEKENEPALRFIRWVQTSVADGSLIWNEQKAMVHFVKEGLLLVTPAIFKEFEKLHGQDGLGNMIKPDAPQGSYIQQKVSATRWNLKKKGNINPIMYDIINTKNKTKSKLNGFVFPRPERWFTGMEINPHLMLNDPGFVPEEQQ